MCLSLDWLQHRLRLQISSISQNRKSNIALKDLVLGGFLYAVVLVPLGLGKVLFLRKKTILNGISVFFVPSLKFEKGVSAEKQKHRKKSLFRFF